MTEKPNPQRNLSAPYFPALDGLRGFAILLIILYHSFNYNKIFEPTWISLDLFFVLSGFLITDILLRRRDSPHFLRDFYMRRVLRIFPLYYLSLVLFLFILPLFILYPFDLRFFLQNQRWFWLYAQNWLFILKSPDNNNFLNHYWSLALEEQFYLLWPWMILLVKTPRRLITLLLYLMTAITAARITVWLLHIDHLPYETMYRFTRIDSLCAGSMLAALRLNATLRLNAGLRLKRSDWIPALLLSLTILVVLPAFKFLTATRLPFFACCAYPAIGLFWALIVRSALKEASFTFRIFSNKPLKFFGKISYGLYIFHWPVYMLLESRANGWTERFGFTPFAANLSAALLSTALSMILAIISYYCIEIHFLKLKSIFVSDQRS